MIEPVKRADRLTVNVTRPVMGLLAETVSRAQLNRRVRAFLKMPFDSAHVLSVLQTQNRAKSTSYAHDR
jgi:hypothetical protein